MADYGGVFGLVRVEGARQRSEGNDELVPGCICLSLDVGGGEVTDQGVG